MGAFGDTDAAADLVHLPFAPPITTRIRRRARHSTPYVVHGTRREIRAVQINRANGGRRGRWRQENPGDFSRCIVSRSTVGLEENAEWPSAGNVEKTAGHGTPPTSKRQDMAISSDLVPVGVEDLSLYELHG